MDNVLLQSLQNRALYDHPVSSFKIVETHISWVILTSYFAYKLKKPVNLGFLDFSTLEKRRFYCEEEVHVNRRLCPDLYEGVVPLTGDPRHPVLGGTGQPFEYAVKMKQFDEQLLWDRLLKRDELQPDLLDRLALIVSAFHKRADVAAPNTPYGLSATFWKSVKLTLDQLDHLLHRPDDRTVYERVARWLRMKHAQLVDRMAERRKEGHVREGHGDMHLRNIALFSKADPQILLFDGIEFDENLRWIDVINDIAFLTMDLDHRDRPDLAWRFLNAYLEVTGDYKGLDLLRLYEANRALVRALVLGIQSREEGQADFPEEARKFLHLVQSYAKRPRPCLYITHGLSGSGKTTVTKRLIEILGAIRIRSDIERKRLFGLAPQAASPREMKGMMYGPQGNSQTYNRLRDLSRHLLKGHFTVVVDAAFLKRDARGGFHELALEEHADFKILDFYAEEPVLKQRIQERLGEKKDASEADIQVLLQQVQTQEDLTEQERSFSIRIDPRRYHEQSETI